MMTKADEIKMFGETIENIEAGKWDCFGNTEYAMMILSDSQTMLEMGHHETARQFINKAKYFMHKDMVEDRQLQDYFSKHMKKQNAFINEPSVLLIPVKE